MRLTPGVRGKRSICSRTSMGLLQASLTGKCCLDYICSGAVPNPHCDKSACIEQDGTCFPYIGSSPANHGLKKGKAGGEMVEDTLVGWNFHDCGTLKVLRL